MGTGGLTKAGLRAKSSAFHAVLLWAGEPGQAQQLPGSQDHSAAVVGATRRPRQGLPRRVAGRVLGVRMGCGVGRGGGASALHLWLLEGGCPKACPGLQLEPWPPTKESVRLQAWTGGRLGAEAAV